MPNTLTGVFQTLVLPAAAELQRPTMFANSMLSMVYVQRQPVPGTIGKTINVNIPIIDEADVVDIGSGSISITDADHTSVSLVININKSIAYKIADFDQVQTPLNFKEFYLQPMIEALTRKIDRGLTALVTAANFNVHTSITGGADTFSRANLSAAWSNLRSVGVPDDLADQFFLTGHVPYASMMADTTFYQESVVGIANAESVQQRAVIAPQLNARVAYDQTMPLPGAGTYAGLFFHRSAIAVVPVLPPPSGEQVMQTSYSPDGGSGLVYRIQFWYEPSDQCWVIHAHCAYAQAIVRPNFGSFLVTT